MTSSGSKLLKLSIPYNFSKSPLAAEMWSPVHVLLIGETIDFQPSSEWLWFKVILFLIVLSVIAFLIKRFNRTGKQLLGNRNAGRIRVTETCSLGNRNFLIVHNVMKSDIFLVWVLISVNI